MARIRRLLYAIALRYAPLLPAWMDVDDLVQEGHIALLLGRRPQWAMLDAIRRTRRMRQRYDAEQAHLPRWREPSADEYETNAAFVMAEAAPDPASALLSRDAARMALSIDPHAVQVLRNMAEGMGVCGAGVEFGFDRNKVFSINRQFRKKMRGVLG